VRAILALVSTPDHVAQLYEQDKHTWRMSSFAPAPPMVMRTGSLTASLTSASTLRGMVAENSSV